MNSYMIYIHIHECRCHILQFMIIGEYVLHDLKKIKVMRIQGLER